MRKKEWQCILVPLKDDSGPILPKDYTGITWNDCQLTKGTRIITDGEGKLEKI